MVDFTRLIGIANDAFALKIKIPSINRYYRVFPDVIMNTGGEILSSNLFLTIEIRFCYVFGELSSLLPGPTHNLRGFKIS